PCRSGSGGRRRRRPPTEPVPGRRYAAPGTKAPLLLVHVREHFRGTAEGLDGRGDAGIDADLEEDLLDLVLAHAVVDRAADVQLELMDAADRAQHRQVDDAARLAVQARPAPDAAPAVFGRELLQRALELVLVAAFDRRLHIFVAQHLAANLQALL